MVEQLAGESGQDALFNLRCRVYNENLADLVLNRELTDKVVEGKGRLIRKKDPVFMESGSQVGRSHFYAPWKNLFGWKVDTFWFNFCVLWLMTLVLYFTLWHDTLRKLLDFSFSRYFSFRK
jgi:hypothetical protein